MYFLRRIRKLLNGCLLIGLATTLAGCGTVFFSPPLPNAPNYTFSLTDLRAIQRDARLSTDEKRAAIRAALSLPDTVEGNRIANFYLNLFIP